MMFLRQYSLYLPSNTASVILNLGQRMTLPLMITSGSDDPGGHGSCFDERFNVCDSMRVQKIVSYYRQPSMCFLITRDFLNRC